MPRTLPSALHVARNCLTQAEGWLLFVEIARRAGGAYRLTEGGRHVLADGKAWQAAGISVELPEESSEGAMGQMIVRVPNVSRLALAAVEVEDEILGQAVTAWLQHESSLATFAPGLRWTHTALRVRADEGVLEIACGHPAASARVPGVRFTRANFPQLLPQGGVRV